MLDIQELNQGLDVRLSVYVTPATKNALTKVARMRHISVSDIVRTALETGVTGDYPEYKKFYDEELKKEKTS